GDTRIPHEYLRASFKQWLALLQGQLDTDGVVLNATGIVEFRAPHRRLVEHVRELICSLGHKPGQVRERATVDTDGHRQRQFHVHWVPLDPVFRVPDKAEQLESAHSRHPFGRTTRRVITSIRPVESVPVRCITVDSPNHLYLAGASMIPTHNTAFALGIARHAAVKASKPVLFFSLEMSSIEVTERLIAAEANVDSKRLRTGRLTTN